MRWRRKRPARCARMTWPLSSSTENVVLGKTCLMLPNTSSGASLGICDEALATRGELLAFRLRIAMGDYLSSNIDAQCKMTVGLPSRLPWASSAFSSPRAVRRPPNAPGIHAKGFSNCLPDSVG